MWVSLLAITCTINPQLAVEVLKMLVLRLLDAFTWLTVIFPVGYLFIAMYLKWKGRKVHVKRGRSRSTHFGVRWH